MGTRPPYLFGSSKDDLRGSRLELISDVGTAMIEMVHAEAVAWGAMPTRVGKVVWATIRHRNRRPL